MGCSSSNIRHLSDNPQWPTNRPIDDRRATLFFFVNGSSGGNAAAKLLQLQIPFMHLHDPAYGSCQIRFFDLKDTDSRTKGFALLKESHDDATQAPRAIACGGDGTVKWVISELRKVDALSVPIGVIPYGTGNDMARVLGWGGSAPASLFKGGRRLKSFRALVRAFMTARERPLDVWQVKICLSNKGEGSQVWMPTIGAKEKWDGTGYDHEHSTDVPEEQLLQAANSNSPTTADDAANDDSVSSQRDSRTPQDPTARTVMIHDMINYFSVGADAKAVFMFEQHRRGTQFANKLEYVNQGMQQSVNRPARLRKQISAVSGVASGHKVSVSFSSRVLVLQNIPSYGGGQDIWKRRGDEQRMKRLHHKFEEQNFGDGKLEMMTMKSTQDLGLCVATNGMSKRLGGIKRAAQSTGYKMKVKPGKSLYFQVDGEAFKVQGAEQILVTRGGPQVTMLARVGAPPSDSSDTEVLKGGASFAGDGDAVAVMSGEQAPVIPKWYLKVEDDVDMSEPSSEHVFMLVNPSSGGNKAAKLKDIGIESMRMTSKGTNCFVHIAALTDATAKQHIIDNILAVIAQGSAKTMLDRVRVVACGGDGSVKWVISEFEKAGVPRAVPIGVIPFGTGNDMARVLGWGAGAPSPLLGARLTALHEKIAQFRASDVVGLDVWKLTMHLPEGSRAIEVKGGKEVDIEVEDHKLEHVMINYFSCGADGLVSFEFEKNRKKTQTANKVQYVKLGTKQAVVAPPRMKKFIGDVSVDGKPHPGFRHSDRAFLMLNIPSYGAGVELWSRKGDGSPGGKQKFVPQNVGDNKLELVTISTLSAVLSVRATNGLSRGTTAGVYRSAQGSEMHVAFKPGQTTYMQVDGEGMKLINAAGITVSRAYQVNMLHASSKAAVAKGGGSEPVPPLAEVELPEEEQLTLSLEGDSLSSSAAKPEDEGEEAGEDEAEEDASKADVANVVVVAEQEQIAG